MIFTVSTVWVSESVACEDVSVSVMYDGEDQYYSDCKLDEPNEDDGVDDYYSIGSVGLFNDDGGTYTFNSSHTIYIVGQVRKLERQSVDSLQQQAAF